MATAGHSRRRSTKQQSSFPLRLMAILRILASAASGKTHRIKAGQHHRHGGTQHHAQTARHRPRERIVLRQVSVMRFSAAVVLFLVFAWIGWRIITDTAAQNLAVSAPADALNWAPNVSTALDQLAQEELRKSDGDLNAAQDWARQALRSHPLDDRALFLLGIAAERKGDATSADNLIRAAGARTWRNLGTQLWLFEHDVIGKDFSAALSHADAMFRVEPKLLPSIFPTIAAFTTDPSASKALADFLVTDPPWRDWFLRSLSTRLYDKSHLDQLYTILMESKSPPTKKELRAYLNRLIKDDRYELAYQKWQDSMQPPLRAKGGFPYNGDFEVPVDGLPFNWSIGSTPGVDVQIVSADGAKGRTLRVQFSGARVQFANVRQLMLLPPGQYRLTGRVKAEDLHTSRGLWWRVFCATGSGTTLAHTDLVSGSLPWSEFRIDFKVPTQSCTAQSLRLELPARIASEEQIEGQVWYQNLRITPATPEARSAG